MKNRRNKLDTIFSNLVRERANYVCQYCCVNKRHEPGTFDCAHIVSRRHVGLRWHPANAVGLCRRHHMYFGEYPFDWSDWCRDYFGGDLIAEIRRVSNIPVHWVKADREAIYQHYRAEYKRMLDVRKSTQMIIDFVPHELMHEFKVPTVSTGTEG